MQVNWSQTFKEEEEEEEEEDTRKKSSKSKNQQQQHDKVRKQTKSMDMPMLFPLRYWNDRP